MQIQQKSQVSESRPGTPNDEAQEEKGDLDSRAVQACVVRTATEQTQSYIAITFEARPAPTVTTCVIMSMIVFISPSCWTAVLS